MGKQFGCPEKIHSVCCRARHSMEFVWRFPIWFLSSNQLKNLTPRKFSKKSLKNIGRRAETPPRSLEFRESIASESIKGKIKPNKEVIWQL